MKRLIVTHALPSECVDLALPGYEVVRLVTGYGKVNSCIKLIECLDNGGADLVLNVGTAGTSAYHIGDILLCTSFVDRDLESTLLPGVEFNLQVPEDTLPPGLLAWESIVDSKPLLRRYTVNTGDNFVRDVVHMSGDVVDMEAYAQAQICIDRHIPFASVKYVTDVIGHNSVKAWESKLMEAQAGLSHYFRNKTL